MALFISALLFGSSLLVRPDRRARSRALLAAAEPGAAAAAADGRLLCESIIRGSSSKAVAKNLDFKGVVAVQLVLSDS